MNDHYCLIQFETIGSRDSHIQGLVTWQVTKSGTSLVKTADVYTRSVSDQGFDKVIYRHLMPVGALGGYILALQDLDCLIIESLPGYPSTEIAGLTVSILPGAFSLEAEWNSGLLFDDNVSIVDFSKSPSFSLVYE